MKITWSLMWRVNSVSRNNKAHFFSHTSCEAMSILTTFWKRFNGFHVNSGQFNHSIRTMGGGAVDYWKVNMEIVNSASLTLTVVALWLASGDGGHQQVAMITHTSTRSSNRTFLSLMWGHQRHAHEHKKTNKQTNKKRTRQTNKNLQ